MYDKIVNPVTGYKVNVNGKIGKNILRNYINQLGGFKSDKIKSSDVQLDKIKSGDVQLIIDSEINKTLLLLKKKNINIIDSKQIISTIELIKILITTIKSLNKYKNIIKYLDYFKTKLEKGIYVNSSIQNGGVNTDDDDICPICFDSLHNGSRLATCAGHGCKFHSDCIKDWFTNSVQTNNYQCPQCRNQFYGTLSRLNQRVFNPSILEGFGGLMVIGTLIVSIYSLYLRDTSLRWDTNLTITLVENAEFVQRILEWILRNGYYGGQLQRGAD